MSINRKVNLTFDIFIPERSHTYEGSVKMIEEHPEFFDYAIRSTLINTMELESLLEKVTGTRTNGEYIPADSEERPAIQIKLAEENYLNGDN